ncbi:hypothetical protein GCM10023194_31240 [Planotetraspora phitsanulokensis]|uniref:histidine kinase n=1 Tax=Planotetraspora phitsanulokensis TaxID=575192 RepID=A0A8J3TZ66_9ACTN|nr:PAS domain-containing sensor histidine kinase [Planotetraspora phitsanulokensis]GII35738.1 hypothetical protein Pph01_07410 [Planotetraspora phitsanulokensis]
MRPDLDYAALFAAVPGPCLAMTPDMTVVAVNQAYLDACGRRREELLGRHVLDSCAPDHTDPVRRRALRNLEASLRRARATGRPDVMAPHKCYMPGGSQPSEERRWSTINSPVLGPDGAVVLFVHRMEDVSASSRRIVPGLSPPDASGAEQLLDRQRQFAADASHELRTPLAALRLRVEEAQLHPGDVDLPDLLGHLTDDLHRLESLIDDLLLLAALEADLGGRLEEVNLTSLVETVAARWAESCDIRLDLEPAVTVEAASWQITRLLVNLLDNARRHATRRLRVDLRRDGDHAELAVADDGHGVRPADRDRIFQRFTRLDTARSRDRGGTGLGLAIARDIASAHCGTLHVEDSADGGACFVLRLPLVS